MPIVGMFFHTFKDGRFHWQGEVMEEPREGYFLVRLFDWIVGAAHWDRKLVKIDDMLEWRFYTTDEEMREAYESMSEDKKWSV